MEKRQKLLIKQAQLVLSVILCAISISYSQTLTTSNLPLILINTQGQQINNEPGIICTFKIINNAGGSNSPTDTPNEYDGKAKVEYRGCSSQSYPKKPLGIELRSTTDVTASIDASLFGFPEESDWVLNPSYIDKSFVRDVLAFYVASASGHYASRYKYVEVIINGDYQGIFVFEEKVKRDQGRINVNKMDPTDLGSNSITGGYVVKIDKSCGNNDPNHQWQSLQSSPGGSRNHYWATDYPNDANIAPQQFTYIQTYINSFETMMASSSCCVGYSSYINDDTFIDYFLAQELASNADAYRFSTFLSKERNSKGGKLSAGPVWDFNLAFGFLTSPFNGNSQSYQGWRYTAPGDSNSPVPFWWGKLLTCPEFGAKLVARYKQLRQTVWNIPGLTTFIDNQYVTLNQGAFARNFQKWPIIGVLTWGDQPAYNGATLEDEFTYLKTWLMNRLAWMDTNICGFTSLPTASLNANSFTVNQGQTAQLTLSFTGISPWSYTLSTGAGSSVMSSTVVISVSPMETTTYTITSIVDGCGTGTSSGTAVVTVLPALPDLSPTIFARPSTANSTKPVSVVVDVFELNGVSTSGLITVKLSKDPKISLNFSSAAISIGGLSVQNSAWAFDGLSDEDYYILTTTQVIGAGDVLSFGLSGTLNSGATSGALILTTVIGPGSGGESFITNNTDADKIDYF